MTAMELRRNQKPDVPLIRVSRLLFARKGRMVNHRAYGATLTRPRNVTNDEDELGG